MSPELHRPIRILFENKDIVVFEKPAGLLVIPTPKGEKNTLLNIVNQQYTKPESYKLHPCHRIDRDTSGAIIFAKGKMQQRTMMELFQKRLIAKRYLAFVQGQLRKPQGVIEASLQPKKRFSGRHRSLPVGAITKYTVIEQRKDFCIVEVEPVTGRTNQIRIHFSQIGHPLVGDRKFSIAKDYPVKFKRTALHARSLKWKDPFTQEEISVQSAIPNDMEVFLARHTN